MRVKESKLSKELEYGEWLPVTKWKWKCQSLRPVRPFTTPWTVTGQAPLSWNYPGKNAQVGCLALLQGIILTQVLNLGLPHSRHCYWEPNIIFSTVTEAQFNGSHKRTHTKFKGKRSRWGHYINILCSMKKVKVLVAQSRLTLRPPGL